MTSEERRERRYQRRRAARETRRQEQLREALDYDRVFTFIHLYRSAQKCFKGVCWKASVQAYKAKCGINVAKRTRDMRAGKWRQKRSPEFFIRERGHERRIHSVHIEDRVPEKCNSTYSLKEVLHRGLIRDNFASQAGKGTDLARRRLKCQLERHIRRHGFAGGILLFDFKAFFDSTPHELVRQVMEKHYSDQRMTELNMRIVQKCGRIKGMVLGSENSQDFAISCPNGLDHFVKERLRAEGYGRYMDDGWVIHPDWEELKAMYSAIRDYAEGLGFRLNERKCRLVRFGKPFVMLKRKYSFTASGGIIQRPVRQSVIRERRKLKRLHRRMVKGNLTAEAGLDSVKAWKASLKGCRCAKIQRSIEGLYRELYISGWLMGAEV